MMDKFVTRNGGPSSNRSGKEPLKPEKHKTKQEIDKNYDIKCVRSFQDNWFDEFTWLQKDEPGVVTCKICRMFPHIADNTSVLYISKTVDNMSRRYFERTSTV